MDFNNNLNIFVYVDELKLLAKGLRLLADQSFDNDLNHLQELQNDCVNLSFIAEEKINQIENELLKLEKQ